MKVSGLKNVRVIYILMVLWLFCFPCFTSSTSLKGVYIEDEAFFHSNNRETFQYGVLAMSLICTWLGFLYPVANAFVLLLTSAPFVFMLFAELQR